MLTESARLRLYMTSDLYLFLHWAGAGGGVPVHDRVRALLDHGLPRPLFRSGWATFPHLETQKSTNIMSARSCLGHEQTALAKVLVHVLVASMYVKHKHDTTYRTYEQFLV